MYEVRGSRNVTFTCKDNSRSFIPSSFNVDNLFIDANPIIHKRAQQVFNYGERRRLIDPYSKLSFKEKEEKV